MADTFISYHSADRPRAEALRRWFEECDWSVWIDREIGIGEGWEQRLQKELEAARLVVVLWSAQARRSERVQREASAAAADGCSRQSQADSECPLPPGSRSTPRRPRFRMWSVADDREGTLHRMVEDFLNQLELLAPDPGLVH